MLEQPKPGDLDDVLRGLPGQPGAKGPEPEGAVETGHEPVPGRLIAGQGPPEKFADVLVVHRSPRPSLASSDPVARTRQVCRRASCRGHDGAYRSACPTCGVPGGLEPTRTLPHTLR